MKKFKTPKSNHFKELVYAQTNDEDQLILRSEDEVKCVGKYINNPKFVLDIGCGLGRSSIYIKNKLSLDNTKFYLADFTGYDYTKKDNRGNKVACGVHQTAKDIPYNDLNLTKELCELNNLTNFELVDLGGSIPKLEKIDVIYSFQCVGYHFGIVETLKKYNFLDLIHNNTVMIYGIRKDYINGGIEIPQIIGDFDLVEIKEGDFLQSFAIYKIIK